MAPSPLSWGLCPPHSSHNPAAGASWLPKPFRGAGLHAHPPPRHTTMILAQCSALQPSHVPSPFVALSQQPPCVPQILSPERLRQSQLKRLTVEIVSLSAGLSRRSAGRELSFRSEKGTQLGSLIARQYSGRRFSLASKSRVTSQILTHL